MGKNDRELYWVGSSRDDLLAFPREVQSAVGFALRAAQEGKKHESVEPLKGYRGAGVLEVIKRFSGDTYRCVYTVQLANAAYVLHCFQKKSTSGIKTPKRDLDMIERRLAEAIAEDAAITKEKSA